MLQRKTTSIIKYLVWFLNVKLLSV